jgi:hypothetical protein
MPEKAKEGMFAVAESQEQTAVKTKRRLVKGKYSGSDEVAGVPARLEIDRKVNVFRRLR